MNFSKGKMGAAILGVALSITLFSGCAYTAATDNLSAAAQGAIVSEEAENTEISPDGKLRIENVNLKDDEANSLLSMTENRIIDQLSGDILWSGESYIDNKFIWSENSRFVTVQCSGRQWTETDVIDTEGFDIIELPGMDDVLKSSPDFARPSSNVPLPLFKAIGWETPEVVLMRFEWTAGDDTIVSGEYGYSVTNKTITHMEFDETQPEPDENASDQYIPTDNGAFDTVSVSGMISREDIGIIISKLRESNWDTLFDVLSSSNIHISPYVCIRRADMCNGMVDVLTNFGATSENDYYIYIASTDDLGLYDVLLTFCYSGDGIYLIQKCMLLPSLKDVYISIVGEWVQLSYRINGTGLAGVQSRWFDKYSLENRFFYNEKLTYTFADEPYTIHAISTLLDTNKENTADISVDIVVNAPDGQKIGSANILYQLRYDIKEGAFYDNARSVRWYQTDLSSKANIRDLFSDTEVNGELRDWLNK